METREVLISVIIGVDPHKATHTAVAIDRTEAELARARVRATRKQVPQLLRWAEPLGDRTWAIESAGGLGYLLAGSGYRPLGQERPERRLVGRDRRATNTSVAPGRRRRSRPVVAALAQAQHRHRQPPWMASADGLQAFGVGASRLMSWNLRRDSKNSRARRAPLTGSATS